MCPTCIYLKQLLVSSNFMISHEGGSTVIYFIFNTFLNSKINITPIHHYISYLIDTNVNQKSVPTNFIRACDAARQRTPPKEDTCIVKVTIDGEDLPQRIQRLIASDVLKFQRRIENKIRGLRN